MSEHQDTRNLLGPYAMGALEPWEEREVEDHLQGCAGCRQEAQELRLVHERLADLARATQEPPRNLEGRLATGIPRREDRRRPPSWAAAVAAVICVLAVFFITDLSGDRALASATLSPTSRAPEAGGEVSIRDAGGNMEVRLEAWGLPACEREQYYELWLVEGEERVSAGSFTVGPSGSVEVDMNAPAFTRSYPAIGITAENDKDPRASDAKMLSGVLREL